MWQRESWNTKVSIQYFCYNDRGGERLSQFKLPSILGHCTLVHGDMESCVDVEPLWYEWDTSYTNWARPKKTEGRVSGNAELLFNGKIHKNFRKLQEVILVGRKSRNSEACHRKELSEINFLESPENIICFSVVTDTEQTAALNSQETSCEISLHKHVSIVKLWIWRSHSCQVTWQESGRCYSRSLLNMQ